MTLSRFEIGILISMSIAIILMNFTFPALGLADIDTNESDIPDYNVSTSEFEVFLETPEQPGAPNKGTLNHTSTQFDDFEGSIQVTLGKNTAGDDVLLVAIETDEVHITNTSAASGVLDNHTFTSEGEIATVSGDGYEVDVIARDLTYGKFDWEVQERPEDSTWFNSIPLVGGIFSAGQQLAGIVGWIGAIIYYFFVSLGVALANVLVIIFDTISFLISAVHWVITTYISIINNAPTSWVKLMVSIPALLNSFIFAKIIMAVISLLPTTGG